MGFDAWSFTKKYILNIDTILVVCIFVVALYFVLTAKKKKYKFSIPTLNGLPDTSKYSPFGKKKKKQKLNKHEEECRRIFQDIFGVRFKSCRPDWLKNPVTKRNLELDGFNENIKTPLGYGLAFEYDGIQHGQFNSHFHKNTDEFVYQVKKDSWKDLKCKEKNIVLIRVPHYVAFQDLTRYIQQELKRNKIDIPMASGTDYLYRGSYQNMYG